MDDGLFSQANPPRVLLVEDNSSTRTLAEYLLKDCCEVEGVADPPAAMAAVGQRAKEPARTFDLFLIDVNLQGRQDGVALLGKLRSALQATAQDVPAVAFTADARPGDEAHYREVGFEDYLAKPFSKQELLQTVAAACG